MGFRTMAFLMSSDRPDLVFQRLVFLQGPGKLKKMRVCVCVCVYQYLNT